MCGRYLIDEEISGEIRRICTRLDERLLSGIQRKEIYPSGKAPVIRGEGEDLVPVTAAFGAPGFQKGKLIINARAETVEEKPFFRDSFENRRCVVPAAGFYEWDPGRNKIFFHRTPGQVMYMAAVYKFTDEDCRFIILTTEGNASMDGVHERMPLVLEREEAIDWIQAPEAARMLLHRTPPLLLRDAEYVQERLKF